MQGQQLVATGSGYREYSAEDVRRIFHIESQRSDRAARMRAADSSAGGHSGDDRVESALMELSRCRWTRERESTGSGARSWVSPCRPGRCCPPAFRGR
ncbi:hypothetical protein CRV15_00005 [Streptomyces clavuligerus]|nr:hypothetical protein D1794_00005 [Streptomyces clavuligerus]QCS04115.1 hypothetical protein CRV15_00005 [Streptomyces clavuligerus]